MTEPATNPQSHSGPVALTEQVIRLRANNPSPMTGSGTNTYLIGQNDLYIIDPGPDLTEHFHAILAAIPTKAVPRGILVTHPHIDHTELVPKLAAMLKVPVYGFGPAGSGRSETMSALTRSGLSGGGEGIDTTFRVDLALRHGDIVPCDGKQVTVHHTPGHMGEHLSFEHEAALFSGDHVMGWSSTLISPPDGDMGCYMASLRGLLQHRWSRFYPGHGEPIAQPHARLEALHAHRLQREAEILAGLNRAPNTATDLVRTIYTDLAPSLHGAAARNVLAHLIDLHRRNEVGCDDPISLTTIFHLK